jgi:hypothetical protein
MNSLEPAMQRKKIPALVAGLLVLQLVAVLAFVLPAHKPEPHGVPVGVVGAPASALEHDQAFDVRTYASEADAEAAIKDREVYGALVAPERRMLVASAASPVVAQSLTQLASTQGATARDVVAIDDDDPRGATLNALFLPLIIVSLPAALLVTHLGLRRRETLGTLGALAALGGLLVVAVVGPVLGLLPGPYLALAGVAALIILAMALPAAALARHLGPRGLGLAALTFLFVGNPGSGNATATELLPGFWRGIGPLLPPGAGGTALRNVAYFDGAALAGPLIVLLAFAAGGAALLMARRRPAPGHAHAAAAALDGGRGRRHRRPRPAGRHAGVVGVRAANGQQLADQGVHLEVAAVVEAPEGRDDLVPQRVPVVPAHAGRDQEAPPPVRATGLPPAPRGEVLGPAPEILR